jgi:hypothetical protein
MEIKKPKPTEVSFGYLKKNFLREIYFSNAKVTKSKELPNYFLGLIVSALVSNSLQKYK